MPRLARALRAPALLAAAAAVPALASAQTTRAFRLCDAASRFCAGADLTLTSATTLQVDLRNLGVPSNQNSFLSGFGLFIGQPAGLTGTLTAASFGTVNLLAASSGGTNDPFAANGAGNDLQSGAGTQPLFAGSDFTNDGLSPCTFGDRTTGGSRRFETCGSEFARFTFTLSQALSADRFAQVGVAVRAQGLGGAPGGAEGNGSDKCFSSGDADCVVTPPTTPPPPPAVVPEPATVALMGAGLLGLAAAARRRRA